MATTQNLSALIKRYQPMNLFVEEMRKRSYLWNKVKKKTGWVPGATLAIPFEGGEYSSLSYGALTDTTDIANMTAVTGTLSGPKELWGSMKFAEADLDATVSLEQAFAQLVPGKTKQFIDRMTQRASLDMLNGFVAIIKDVSPVDGSTNADTPSSGIVYVDHPEYLTIGERINIDDDDSAALTSAAYVVAIDYNTKLVTIQDARSAGSGVNLSAYTETQNAKIYTVGGTSTAGFTSLRSQLLSSANGGSSTQFGSTKTTYPILQAQNFSGAAITSANILDVVNDFFYSVKALGKGDATEVLMSYKNFKNCANGLQDQRRFMVGDKKGGFGYNSINLMGPENDFAITAIRDVADDVMYIVDWNVLQFHGDQFFERKRHLNGEEFFLERATTGYSYIQDIKLTGDLVCVAPSYNGIVYGINYV